MSPYREDREPCRECARREADERAKEAARKADRKPFDWTPVFLVAGILAVPVLMFLALEDVHGGDKSKACYYATEDKGFQGDIWITVPHKWSDAGFEHVRTLPSLAEAKRFLAEKGAKVCP